MQAYVEKTQRSDPISVTSTHSRPPCYYTLLYYGEYVGNGENKQKNE